MALQPDMPDDYASRWLAAIIDSADDAIIGKTLEGIVTSWNEGARRIFGYTAGEIIGRPILTLIPPELQQEEPQILARIRSGERVDHFETVRMRKDGSRVDVSLTVSPIKAPSGEVIGASKIARDISERKRANERVAAALRRAEETNQLKDEFLATVSHELRTPLTAMMGWIRLLRTGALGPAETERAIETIERNTRSQAQLIEDLLDVSRIITGKMRLDVRQVSPASVIASAIETVRPAAQAKSIEISMTMSADAGPVSADPDRLQQVVWNLLSNAIKFTPEGGKVDVVLRRKSSHVEIAVSDTGEGIDPAYLPSAFDRFSQADRSTTRVHGGLGVGLSVVKSIVELHGGTVSAHSEGTGKGATFRVTLPLGRVPALLEGQIHHPRARASVPCPRALDGLRILVVDDEADTSDMITAAFRQCGSIVRSSASGADALAELDGWRPGVIIADISMPGMDGFEFIRTVRNRSADRGGKVAAVALTAMTRIEDRMKALAAGYHMHVGKPVEIDELRQVVAGLREMVPG